MTASMATSAFFTLLPSSNSTPPSSSKPTFDSLNLGTVAKPNPSSKATAAKTHAAALPKINGNNTELTNDDIALLPTSAAPRTFYNQLPDWSMLLAAVTTVFFAAEKHWTVLDRKPWRPDAHADTFVLGKIVEEGRAFRQNFSIRSYEIGADRTTPIETLMNHLQETALNHVRSVGLLGDGFGATPEMSKKNLIWVVAKMQVFVEYYPSWGDVLEVNTWACPSGKNGLRRDWHARDIRTGQTIMKATSWWVLMNKNTRRLSKMPEEVRAEIGPYYSDRTAIIDEDNRKLPKLNDDTADYIRSGLSPRWSDLDMNQHVNNVKYIGWILESAPISLLESHELASMTLEYRRECGRDSVLQSLTAVVDTNFPSTAVSTEGVKGSPRTDIQCNHMLRLECGAEIVRACTEWRPKRAQSLRNMGPFSTGST